jgi:hypothetical protein
VSIFFFTLAAPQGVQRATEVAIGGLQVAVDCHCAIKLSSPRGRRVAILRNTDAISPNRNPASVTQGWRTHWHNWL